MERVPNLNAVNGNDFTERPLIENVTGFNVTLIPQGWRNIVEISLDAANGNATIHLDSRERVGGAK